MGIHTIGIESTGEVQLIDITPQVEALCSHIQEGVCVVFTRHTTSAIVVNENEEGLKRDFISTLHTLIPKDRGYAHDRIDDNAHSHLKAMILPTSVSIPVHDGKLMLGTWQRVFFVELDGPRSRRVLVSIIRAA